MMNKKIVAILGIIGCIGFIFAGLYVYLFKGASLQLLIIDILFCGMGIVVSITSLISKRESWAIDVKKLTKKQSIIMGICGIIFSICSLWVAIAIPLHIILRVILFVGFITIGKWSIGLLLKHRTSRT